MILFSSVNSRRFIPTKLFPLATPRQIEEHIEECTRAMYMPEGGLTLNIELNYEVPMENCYALLEAVEKYRFYK